TVTLAGSGERIQCQRLLMAAGQEANTDGIGCELVGVRLGRYDRVEVDEHLRTSNPRIFAAGDVIGPPGLASTAARQGKSLGDHLFGDGADSKPVAALYPTGVWTIPEVATV